MTFEERLCQAWQDGVDAERARHLASLEELHQHHAAVLLERERWRALRGSTLDLDPRVHFARGALHALERVLASLPAPRDSGEGITATWLEEQLKAEESKTTGARLKNPDKRRPRDEPERDRSAK